jgi:hypothetical protein
MILSREYLKGLLKKHMEGTASAAEIELILDGMDLFGADKIKKMIDEIDPDIDFDSLDTGDIPAPPFWAIIDLILGTRKN